MKRALVLGGGGSVGLAWEAGVVAGLTAGGIDLTLSDVVIGTSAGSVVGANIAHRRDPQELTANMRNPVAARSAPAAPPDQSIAIEAFTIWGSVEHMTEETAAKVGAVALRHPGSEEEFVGSFVTHGLGWPEAPLLTTAVDCESGALRVFDASQGVPIERAVAASCSVPGVLPPITIEGRRYTDGGVRSFSNADLAQRIEPDVVLIVAVFGTFGRGVHLLAARQLVEETASLEAAGASVRVIEPDAEQREAIGPNLMDMERRVAAASAGEAYGRQKATALREWWVG